MSENAPTRSLDDIDLAALRVSIVILRYVLHYHNTNLWQSCPLSYEQKCQSDESTSI